MLPPGEVAEDELTTVEALSCALVACGLVEKCGLEGGCVQERFKDVPQYRRVSEFKAGTKALNGTKPKRRGK